MHVVCTACPACLLAGQQKGNGHSLPVDACTTMQATRMQAVPSVDSTRSGLRPTCRRLSTSTYCSAPARYSAVHSCSVSSNT
jgi:hypothetical protein